MTIQTITEIRSNGSKWYGQQPDTIETLLSVLESETLDPTFQEYGNFVYDFNPYRGWNEKNEIYKGCTSISGNFLTYSHVFNIITNDGNIINRLSAAIRSNQQREEYKQANIERKADKKLKEIAQQKFNNKELSLQELYSFPMTAEGEQLREQIKNELLAVI